MSNTNAPLSIQIIPAEPNYTTIISIGNSRVDSFKLAETVIAWRIETYNVIESDRLFSVCVPLTVDGDAVSNCIGVQNPDNTVTIFNDGHYPSLSAFKDSISK